MELLVGTTNPGKLNEVSAFLNDSQVRIISLSELKNAPEIVEDGATFEANALKKARTLAGFYGYPTLADDSGLLVEALNGAPGVHSARYAGPDADDARNNAKLLSAMSDVPEEKRTARFVCVLALVAPHLAEGKAWLFRGECEGQIGYAPRGKNGFGYDPLFFYPPLGKTFGELDRAAKSNVSHRGIALRKLVVALTSLFSLEKQP